MLKFRFSPQDLGMRYKLLECATRVLASFYVTSALQLCVQAVYTRP